MSPVCAGSAWTLTLVCWLVGQAGFVSCRAGAPGEGRGIAAEPSCLTPLCPISLPNSLVLALFFDLGESPWGLRILRALLPCQGDGNAEGAGRLRRSMLNNLLSPAGAGAKHPRFLEPFPVPQHRVSPPQTILQVAPYPSSISSLNGPVQVLSKTAHG